MCTTKKKSSKEDKNHHKKMYEGQVFTKDLNADNKIKKKNEYRTFEKHIFKRIRKFEIIALKNVICMGEIKI